MGSVAIADNIAERRQTLNASDPTRTVGIRRAFVADNQRRYRNLMRAVQVSVVELDALGLALEQPAGGSPARLLATPTQPREFAFARDPDKIDEFMDWLAEQEAASTLEIVPGPLGVQPGPWSNQYLQSSYTRSLRDNLVNLRRAGADVPSVTLPGSSGVMGLFHAPIHQDRIQMIYTRTFQELRGITGTMNATIRDVITTGLIEGVSPTEMARRINNRIAAVGRARANMIARTEVVETYNQAAVTEFERAGAVIGETVLVEWQTAEDERVRSNHRNRNGKIFTSTGGLCLIGEPNCRCALLPFLQSVSGPRDVSSAGSFKAGC